MPGRASETTAAETTMAETAAAETMASEMTASETAAAETTTTSGQIMPEHMHARAHKRERGLSGR